MHATSVSRFDEEPIGVWPDCGRSLPRERIADVAVPVAADVVESPLVRRESRLLGESERRLGLDPGAKRFAVTRSGAPARRCRAEVRAGEEEVEVFRDAVDEPPAFGQARPALEEDAPNVCGVRRDGAEYPGHPVVFDDERRQDVVEACRDADDVPELGGAGQKADGRRGDGRRVVWGGHRVVVRFRPSRLFRAGPT